MRRFAAGAVVAAIVSGVEARKRLVPPGRLRQQTYGTPPLPNASTTHHPNPVKGGPGDIKSPGEGVQGRQSLPGRRRPHAA